MDIRIAMVGDGGTKWSRVEVEVDDSENSEEGE